MHSSQILPLWRVSKALKGFAGTPFHDAAELIEFADESTIESSLDTDESDEGLQVTLTLTFLVPKR